MSKIQRIFPEDCIFKSVMRGYDKLEPTFIAQVRNKKDAPVDKFIKYVKEEKNYKSWFGIKNIIDKLFKK